MQKLPVFATTARVYAMISAATTMSTPNDRRSASAATMGGPQMAIRVGYYAAVAGVCAMTTSDSFVVRR